MRKRTKEVMLWLTEDEYNTLKKKVEKLIREYDTLQWNQNKKFSEKFSKNFEHSDKN